MTPEVYSIATLTVAVAILGFLWTLHRDVADLRERMARLEGLFEGFTKRRNTVPRPRSDATSHPSSLASSHLSTHKL